jgi:alpha-tubulin suppressor-like RCC1 family protein
MTTTFLRLWALAFTFAAFGCTAAPPPTAPGCATSPCGANAVCTDTIAGGVCRCEAGYVGDGKTCTAVCLVNNGGCDPNAECLSTEDGRQCRCRDGFAGDGLSCADIDECAQNNGGCDPNAICANNAGGRTCSCPSSLTVGDGTWCANAWETMDARWTHSCAIRPNGTLWCWGVNADGELGDGTTERRLSPVQVGVDTDWMSVSVGLSHTCGLRAGGKLWCWGKSTFVGAGQEDPAQSLSPVAVAPDRSWKAVSSGSRSSCAIRSDDTLWCWGSNASGRLGDGTTGYPNETFRLSPAQVGDASDWRRISVGAGPVCGVRGNGTLWCWGINPFGQLGNGTKEDQSTPQQIGTETDWTTVDVLWAHSCGLRGAGSLWCWGSQDFGGLGNDVESGTALSPVRIGDATDWNQVDVGNGHSCGLRADESVWCWGMNYDAQLGLGHTRKVLKPTLAGRPGWKWRQVHAGYYLSCGLTDEGALWCSGANPNGQLGDGAVSELVWATVVR